MTTSLKIKNNNVIMETSNGGNPVTGSTKFELEKCDDLIDENWLPNDSDTDSDNNNDTNNIDNIYNSDTEDDWDMDEDEPTALSNVVDSSETNIWTEFTSRQKTFTFTGRSGLQQPIPTDISCIDAFLLFVDNDVIEVIVSETNKYAEEYVNKGALTRFSRKKNWIPTTDFEMKNFLGLLLWMGLVKVGSLKDYWSKDLLYNFSIPGRTMSRNRFQLLLSFLHFTDNNSIVPGENIVIDETLIPWRGRLSFRQYIPNKAHPYGKKLFKLCATEGFTWALKIYSGKSSSGLREVGLAKSVCEDLIIELARSMLDQKTHVVGTLRANKKHFPKEVMIAPIKKGEVVAREDPNGIVVLKWKDKRDVRMLTTKHAPIMVSPTDGARNSEEPSTSRGARRKRRATENPLAVVEYNKGKQALIFPTKWLLTQIPFAGN
ncbi:piggyBac transposable element-derived protein 4-like [Anastrepha obliqua]|uniref:piggyBac transposable element-derived protein 4-like n=1 Tax=Anastrepha obliqua TaxID=95512 RepID=UPI002409E53A|nr:piggyBac transposable element-derived protein 4-like [Anastrepha obliqua]